MASTAALFEGISALGLVVLALAILALTVAFLTVHSLLRSEREVRDQVRVLRTATMRIRDGHYDHRVDTSRMNPDLAAVGEGLNGMASMVAIVQGGLEGVVRERTQALRESEARYRAIVEDVRDYAIILLDPQGRVATWNRGAERLTGYKQDEALGRPINLFYLEQDRRAGRSANLLEKAREKGSVVDEGWRVRKDGRRLWAQVTLTALHDEEGEPLGFSKVVRDLTDRRELEERLRRSNEDLQNFAYSASHDLRQPARSIGTYLDLVQQEAPELGEEARRYLERALDASDRMQSLIDGILAYSRASRDRPERQDVDLAVVLEYVQDDLSAQIADADALVEIGPLPHAYADERHLHLAFQNLLANAIKFRRQGVRPEVRVRGRQEGLYSVVEVQDNGIGIAPRHARKVFGMFQRLHPRDAYGGHGIGLALVKRVVETNGGSVAFRSKEGEGTTFVVRLPAMQHAPRPVDPAAGGPNAPLAAGGTETPSLPPTRLDAQEG